MTSQEEKYLIGAQEVILNTVINLHAESRATKELMILLANKVLTFPEGQSAQGYWQALCDKAFGELSQQNQNEMLKKLR